MFISFLECSCSIHLLYHKTKPCLFYLYVYLSFLSLFLFLNNKYKIMTKKFVFTHFDLNIHHSFLYFVCLKGFVLIFYFGCTAQTTYKIVKPTWQRIGIFRERKSWYDIFAISPTPNVRLVDYYFKWTTTWRPEKSLVEGSPNNNINHILLFIVLIFWITFHFNFVFILKFLSYIYNFLVFVLVQLKIRSFIFYFVSNITC